MSRYQNQPIRFGLQGLVLKRARDLVSPSEATILTNLYNFRGGKMLARRGQTTLGQNPARTRVHTIRRLNAVGGTTYARFYGMDTTLQLGTAGNPAQVATGYSGFPLNLLPYRSEIAGDAWMYVGDFNQMNKVRIDGLVMPIGLPAPSSVPTSALATLKSTTIDAMSSTTGWAGHHDAFSNAPTVNTSAPSPPSGGAATTLVTAAGAFNAAYTSWMDKALTVDLTSVGGIAASSSDYLHLWLYVDFPQDIVEVRVYFVTSAFTAGVVPGTSATQNIAGYWRSFAPDAFTAAIAGAPSLTSALTFAEIVAAHASARNPTAGTPVGTAVPISGSTVVGAGTWTEFGVVGRPLYRSDFTPFGQTTPITSVAPNGSWGTVTGIVIWVSVVGPQTSGAAAPNVKVAVNNSYLFGGYGLDSGPAGNIPYNWVYTNYDQRTGAESNLVGTVAVPTPTTPDLDALRAAVNITPAAYGDGNIRQRFYRKGGTITDDWYFTGVNASDGGVYQDTQTDAFVFGTGLTAPVDHFQPVPTVNASGVTVLAQPVPSLWGPVQGMLFACGDPYRPGWLYSSKPTEPDHWFNAVEVCSSSETLIAGCVYDDRAFVFSTEKGYQIIPNLDAGGGLTTLPTPCQHGLAARWGLTVGVGGIYFCGRDGIYRTTGGDEGVPLSDDIRVLFDPTVDGPTNGYYPIDFAHGDAIRLHIVGTDLWFGYQDTNGGQQWMIYSLLYEEWRHYGFTYGVAEVYLEEGVNPQSILLGETTLGLIDTYSGVTDRGTAIPWHYRSGALDQGQPRATKRFGNWMISHDDAGGTCLAQAYLDDETIVATAVSITSSGGRQYSIFDPFTGATTRGLNLSMDLSGASSVGQPILYLGEMAYEAEPADYNLWETDELDHGITGWQIPLFTWLAIRRNNQGASQVLTLTRTIYDDRLNILATETYTLTATQVKSHIYLPFNAQKGALFKYRIVGVQPFRIYEEETTMTIQSCQGGPPIAVRPFGTRDESGLQADLNPLLAAIRPGGAS